MKYRAEKSGFTLVEILVALGIIGVLTSVVLAGMANARKDVRDKERVAELEQLQVPLRLFADKYGRYPSAADGKCRYYESFGSGGCLEVLVTEGLIEVLPVDPQNEAYTGNWTTSQMYFYDNWCRDKNPKNDDGHYRMWTNGETDRGATAQNWWSDTTIGVTTCGDPS